MNEWMDADRDEGMEGGMQGWMDRDGWRGGRGCGGGLVAKSCPTLVPWTIACHALLAIGFLRQEYWSGFPLPSPGHLPDPGIEPGSPALQADSLPTELQGKPLFS